MRGRLYLLRRENKGLATSAAPATDRPRFRCTGQKLRPRADPAESSRYGTRAAGVAYVIASAIAEARRQLPPSRITLNACCSADIATVVNTTYPLSPLRRTSFTLATVNCERSLRSPIVLASISPSRLPQLCSIALLPPPRVLATLAWACRDRSEHPRSKCPSARAP